MASETREDYPPNFGKILGGVCKTAARYIGMIIIGGALVMKHYSLDSGLLIEGGLGLLVASELQPS